ncbi:VOC family protein [Microbacterium invictum]|uniref:VOC family protein n=1 Tax=Microbacterium invictum TaxID=515415 RepID=A0ABZ0V9S5_9MICO|nr:VOC family protein [Microbacterium invictum]WQB70363.1 VOC family protein [Microbacterium invictum]
MLRGFATISYYADDLDAARDWYTTLVGIEPYYVVPGYIEFRVGDDEHELGIIDGRYRPPMPDGPAGAVMQWAVDDVDRSLATLLERGARGRTLAATAR